MKFAPKVVLRPLSNLIALKNELCKPSPSSSKDHIQQEIDHERNKVVVNFYIGVMIMMLFQTITNRCTVVVGLVMAGLCILKLAILLISCRFDLSLFKMFFSLAVSLVGPVLMFLNAEGGQRAWLASQVYPTLVLLCTGSINHYIFQVGLQIILINFFYQSQMLHYLDFTPPEDFLRTLTRNSTTFGLVNAVIVVCLDSSLRKAYNKIQLGEKKKEELERQKIFLLGFSHELRNIINSLMGNVKLASLENLSEKTRNFLKNADVCTESLLHLINNILDSGKVEIGELEINLAPTNIYNTMDQMWKICSEQIKSKSLQGSLKFASSIPEILQVDHYRLMQIFFNLIGNAVKFTDKGSINVTVEWIPNTESVTEKSFEPYPFYDDDANDEEDLSEGILDLTQQFEMLNSSNITVASTPGRAKQKSLEQQLEIQKGVLKVIVTDTGNGIATQDIDKLFQKFSQVSCDPSKRKLGTGLGLFITKELCERMGGKIKVFSKEEKGSSFIFCIPITPLPTDRFARSFSITTERKKSLRALIVDDDVLGRDILQSFFCKLQIEIGSTAQNGLEAYKNYVDSFNRGEPLDLVTMDLTMPVMDGKTAAEKIRRFEKEKGIEPCLLIVVSGNCSESEITECTCMNGEIRANFFLKKPARIDELNRVISQYKKEKRGHQNDANNAV